MRKIRIGNDIRLAVDLRQYIGSSSHLREREVYNPDAPDFEGIDDNIFVNKKNPSEVYYPNQYDDQEGSGDGQAVTIKPTRTAIGIRSIKAYLINTTMIDKHQTYMRKKSRFVARFPIEPCLDCFHPTPYNLCNSGYPTWRAYPHRYCASPYHGYGVRPEWNGIYHKFPIRADFEYFAPVMATEEQNVVEVAFPAVAQRFTGVYKLIVVAKVYAPGYNAANLKTITLDVPNVFELVKTTAEGIDSEIAINVSHVEDVLTNIGPSEDDTIYDIYVNSCEYSDNNITLGRTDGVPVDVDVSEFTAWYEGD